MANLIETDNWPEGVYRIEEDDPVLGGPTGITNTAPTQLAARSRYQRLRNITSWDATLVYPADLAYVNHAGSTWRSRASSVNVQPGSDAMKWERWGHSSSELAAEAVGRLLSCQVFETPGVHIYNKTPGTTKVVVEVQGAGGAGGSCPGINDGARVGLSGGGGGGAYALATFTAGLADVVITVGAGGAVAAVGANAGGIGGTSSFGSLCSAPGGVGGTAGVNLSTPTVSGGGLTTGAPSGANLMAVAGAAAAFCIAINGSNGFSSNGGASQLGVAGQAAPSSAGRAGQGYGSGGSGVFVPGNFTQGLPGGPGRDGVVIVWEYS